MTALADTWGINAAQFWLRGERPDREVRYDETTGMWEVHGYPEILRALSDPATFSSHTQRLIPEASGFTEGNLTQLDPPDHQKLRKVVSHAFTPKVVADLEPRIAELTRELMDRMQGRAELVVDLAYPLPVTVIAELLGVPASDRDQFKRWVDGMFNSTNKVSIKDRSPEDEEYFAEAMAQVGELTAYLAGHVRERRAKPREDLLTKLVEAEVDGVRLGDAEITNFGMVLLVAGHITTTMLLGNTLLCLDAHPDQFERVRDDWSLVPSAIEESLRFLSPFAAVSRVTDEETELGGVRIPADQLLLLWIAAANRDPRQFAEPNAFDVTRDPNPQLGFGRGIHFCLGAPLARLEGKIALNLLLDRFPRLRTDPDDTPQFLPSPNMTGVSKLPLLL
ncbi:cytochrome P450 [Saccharopolyspora mangrovi]|uniref:Cytochrome P450 n=1 Tax=Saccharopolyspora mangrovi TaxID=3082379 RepID=A0ABU6ADL5_9PSEU|nr:cytochrome P450 [Saccharopolyspora sp. S2-29]MEB3369557.1 cytochrome P450 [Saccharopolyspora sp. S2-29]